MNKQLAQEIMDELRKDPQTVWSPHVASAYIGVSFDTLKKWRRTGEGPKYIRLSHTRVGYQKSSLAAWIETRIYSSISEEVVLDPAQPAVTGGFL